MDNGIEIKKWEDFGFRPLKDHSNPSQPIINHTYMHIPGRSGAYDFGTEIEQRDGIAIPLHKLIEEESEINGAVNQLNRFFFDEFKQPRSVKVIFDYESNKYVWLKIQSSFTINRATILSKIEVPFVQFDDNKYSIVEADEITWGSEEITFEADYSLGHTGTGAQERQITSNTTLNPFIEGLAITPFIVLKGTGTNVRIICDERTIDVGTFSNQTIEIDTGNFVVYKNGIESEFDLDEFYFVPNKSVSVTGTNMNFTLTFHYRDIYM